MIYICVNLDSNLHEAKKHQVLIYNGYFSFQILFALFFSETCVCITSFSNSSSKKHNFQDEMKIDHENV